MQRPSEAQQERMYTITRCESEGFRADKHEHAQELHKAEAHHLKGGWHLHVQRADICQRTSELSSTEALKRASFVIPHCGSTISWDQVISSPPTGVEVVTKEEPRPALVRRHALAYQLHRKSPLNLCLAMLK